MPTPSNIVITYDGVDISDRILYSQCRFVCQALPIQGNFTIVVKDEKQEFSPQIGSKVTLSIDGVPVFGGYNMVISRDNFFPAVDTTDPGAVTTRRWKLSGPDYNFLFDKRVVIDDNDPYTALRIPSSKRGLSDAIKYLFQSYIDVPSEFDYTTHVDEIDAEYGGSEENSGLYLQQGSTLREQMDDFVEWGAIIYYLLPNKQDPENIDLHVHEWENTRHSWVFADSRTDAPNVVGFREGEYEEDYQQIVTDALVWGGSSLARSGEDPATDTKGRGVLFARYPDPPAEDETWAKRLQSKEKEEAAIARQQDIGRWQMAEMRVGSDNYLIKAAVKYRAYAIINGPAGAVPTYGIESGFSRPLQRMRCVWFAHDVPGADHVYPGDVMDFILYTQGTDVGHPKVTSLPLRSMTITFPTLPSDNPSALSKAYVRFEGEFGLSFSDSRHLWKYLRRRERRAISRATVVADDNSDSVTPGTRATLSPINQPNGVDDWSRFKFAFSEHADVYINGLLQRNNLDYQWNSIGTYIFWTEPPAADDQIYVIGLVTEP